MSEPWINEGIVREQYLSLSGRGWWRRESWAVVVALLMSWAALSRPPSPGSISPWSRGLGQRWWLAEVWLGLGFCGPTPWAASRRQLPPVLHWAPLRWERAGAGRRLSTAAAGGHCVLGQPFCVLCSLETPYIGLHCRNDYTPPRRLYST